MNISSDTTLLEALSEGASVTLPNQVTLKGDPETQYIEIGYIGLEQEWVSEGLWDLSKEGLEDAIKDSRKIAEDIAGVL